jgi:hypothetical protein
MTPAVEDVGDLLGDLDADGVLRLGGRGAQVGRQGDVGEASAARCRGQGLLLVDVEARGGHLAALQAPR